MRPLALLLLAGAGGLAGCAAPTAEAPPVVAAAPAVVPTGLEAVIGSTAGTLVTQLGRPAVELREGSARKLQFLGTACVLDVYLYPPSSGAEPVVTHVDARQPDGREMDRAACVGALSTRPQTP